MLLTSRFRFPQLERYAGTGFHHLSLVRLSSEDGVTLLDKLGVLGDINRKVEYVEKLSGHPLALRVLAATVRRCCHGELEQFKGALILEGVGEDDKLGNKLRHLLGFYEKQLQNGQKELLGILSLFKRPVEVNSFVTLLKGMKSIAKTRLAEANEAEIKTQLEALANDFLIEKTREGCITTHPIIRDYFRTGLRVAGSKKEVADFLKARPGEGQPKNIEEVRDLVEAVQLLCDEGEFRALAKLSLKRSHYRMRPRIYQTYIQSLFIQHTLISFSAIQFNHFKNLKSRFSISRKISLMRSNYTQIAEPNKPNFSSVSKPGTSSNR